MSVSVKTLQEDEFFYGHKACAGCGGSLAVRIALKVLGERSIAVLPAGWHVGGRVQFSSALLRQQRHHLHFCRNRLHAYGH